MKNEEKVIRQIAEFISKNHPRFTAQELSDLTGIPVRALKKYCEEKGFKMKDAPIKKWTHTSSKNQIEKDGPTEPKFVRVRGEYTNLQSPYGIASEMRKKT